MVRYAKHDTSSARYGLPDGTSDMPSTGHGRGDDAIRLTKESISQSFPYKRGFTMFDRLTILTAFANRSTLPVSWKCPGVVQRIEHENGSGNSWIVTMQPNEGKSYMLCVQWSDNGTGRIIGHNAGQ